MKAYGYVFQESDGSVSLDSLSSTKNACVRWAYQHSESDTPGRVVLVKIADALKDTTPNV